MKNQREVNLITVAFFIGSLFGILILTLVQKGII